MVITCSVVIPLCNEERNLPILHTRLTDVFTRLGLSYEIIYVDDGSTDRTPEIIHGLHQDDPATKGIFLSRNFGHQAALCAGLSAASGQAVISMDGDLQDPPELIPELVRQWREGYQIVFARRRRRKEHFLKRTAYFTFYRLLRMMSEIEIPLDTGDFALMDRQAVDELNNLPERTRFIRGLRSWVGFKQTEVLYDRDARHHGETKYSLSRLFRLAMDGIFVFSDAPLKLITLLGCFISILAVLGLSLSLLIPWRVDPSIVGMFAVGSGLVLLGGIQLVGLGVVGEYMGRIYREVRARPLYVTRSRIGFDPVSRLRPEIIEFERGGTLQDQHEPVIA
jgi:dolichol-phosphate mannosyltransferase